MLLAGFVAVTCLFMVSCAVDEGVIFSAAITAHITIEKKTTVVFNKVFANKGNGYNKEDGVFTAPRAGFYIFHVNIESGFQNYGFLDLFKNDQYLVSVYGSEENDLDHGGNSIAVELAKGDTVYAKTQWKSVLYNALDEIYATFTGYFITD